jgi:hypothetical protein
MVYLTLSDGTVWSAQSFLYLELLDLVAEDPAFEPDRSMRMWLENESEYPGVTGRSDTRLFEPHETAALEEALARAAAFAATRRDELDISGCSVNQVTRFRASATRLRELVAMVTAARAKA